MSPLHPYVQRLRSLAVEIDEFLNGEFLPYLWSDEFSNLEHLVGVADSYADLLSHDDLAASLDEWITAARAEFQQYRDELTEDDVIEETA